MDLLLWINNGPNSNVFGFEARVSSYLAWAIHSVWSHKLPLLHRQSPSSVSKIMGKLIQGWSVWSKSRKRIFRARDIQFTGVIESNKVKGTVRMLVCKSF